MMFLARSAITGKAMIPLLVHQFVRQFCRARDPMSSVFMPAAVHGSVKPAKFALGLGLTNECNLACAFCYRDPTRTDRLSLDQVRQVMESIPVRSVNLGTGENGLHPDFLTIVGYLREQPIKLTMTSNGYSVAAIADSDLEAFSDI